MKLKIGNKIPSAELFYLDQNNDAKKIDILDLCKNNRVLILKGASTFIFSTTGKVYVLNNGNSLLATAGSGDVLSGMILGLLAKGYGLDQAAILGVYVHGLTSQRHSERYSSHSMLATDIIESLPSCFNEIYA